MTTMREPVYGVLALALAAADRDAPAEILLLPAGELRTRPSDARPSWHNTDPAAVVAATRALTLDLPIDFEHQTQRAKSNGRPAPAAGWIKRVFERDLAIWGAVEWVAEAARMIVEKQYRFISPVFSYDKARQVQRIHGAALVNDPALYMPALAKAGEDGEDMSILERIRAALGLKADATEDEMVDAAAAMREGRDGARAAAAVDKYARQGRISAAMREPMLALARRDPDGFDAVAAALPVTAEADATRGQAAVDRSMAEGRVPPAARDQAIALARRDPDAFAAFASALPVAVEPASDALARLPGRGAGQLTDTERTAARALGLSDEQYLESRQALAAARA